MTVHIASGGSYRNVKKPPKIVSGGVWRQVKQGWMVVNGVWRKLWKTVQAYNGAWILPPTEYSLDSAIDMSINFRTGQVMFKFTNYGGGVQGGDPAFEYNTTAGAFQGPSNKLVQYSDWSLGLHMWVMMLNTWHYEDRGDGSGSQLYQDYQPGPFYLYDQNWYQGSDFRNRIAKSPMYNYQLAQIQEYEYMRVDYINYGGRAQVNIAQQPAAWNDWTFIIHFHDGPSEAGTGAFGLQLTAY